jgi:photosystem II stability/assembly factor-like uncharacterized protein
MRIRRGFAAAALVALVHPADAVSQASSPPPSRAARAQVMYDARLFDAMKWRQVGPARGGRVTAVAGVIQEPGTFYFGSTGGGVWKTIDAGNNWYPITDAYFDVGSIGAIDVSDSDPRVVWVGTGSDGIRSNVSTGRGIWRSTDAGVTWAFMGLRETGQIGAVVIHPTDPNTVWVAAIGNVFGRNTERGVFKTTDGGVSWRRTLFLNDSVGAVDIEMQPGNPSVLYASMWRGERKPWTVVSGSRDGGIYKSTDGGETWRKLTSGLPSELFGKSDLATTAADPRRVYAVIEAKPGSGVYRSDDAGETWRLTADRPLGLYTRPFYYTNIDAHPTNPDVVFVQTEGFYRSTDGGRTWSTMRTPHGDNHDLWINPRQPDTWVQANDGGANVTYDAGKTWSTQYNQPTAEIYQVAVDNQWPYRLYGAQQDNTTLIVPSLPPTTSPPDDPIQLWQAGPGCETGPIVPHRTNPDTVYGSCKGQFSRMSLRSGQERQYWVGAQSLYGNNPRNLIFRFQRVSPLELSPHDTRTIYYGSQYVHRSRDEGVTWTRISPDLTANDPRYHVISGTPITIDVTGEEVYSTLYAIRESALEPGVIWTGANDGPIHVTRDGGATWRKVTPAGLPEGGRVQTIELSPHRRGSAYVAVLRYMFDDWKPYIYRTNDYGRSWTLLTPGTNGIPADHPTRVVREDPDREGLLYAGTEFGMFVSFDNGTTWRSLQLNLPHVPVTDMRVHRKDLVISTQGRGFWILDNLTPLQQMVGIDPEMAAHHPDGRMDASHRAEEAAHHPSAMHLFQPREAVRIRYRAGGGGEEGLGRPAGPASPQFPAPGAQIDYFLPNEPTSEVRLDIIRVADGKVVRSFSSRAAGEDSAEVVTMRSVGMERSGTPKLPAAKGLNRFTWDLSWPGPWDATPQRSGRNGPMVAPGAYRVRLSVGDWKQERPLTVRTDPRAVRDGITTAILADQEQFNLRARDLVSSARRVLARTQEARRRLAGATGAAADTLTRIQQLERTLVPNAVRYSEPALITHITYLYSMSLGADQRISDDARQRLRVLEKELADAEARLGR